VTQLGKRALELLRSQTPAPEAATVGVGGLAPAQLGLAMALFGAGVLWSADTDMATALMVPRETGSPNYSTAGGCGGGGSGGGGGGCGGGGCGGGCGGGGCGGGCGGEGACCCSAGEKLSAHGGPQAGWADSQWSACSPNSLPDFDDAGDVLTRAGAEPIDERRRLMRPIDRVE